MSSKAKDVVFTLMEMEAMYKSNQAANVEYDIQFAKLSTEARKISRMIIPPKYSSFEDYKQKVMQELADVSHGDIVLMDAPGEFGLEIKRVPANYQAAKMYSRITKEK